MINIGIVGVNGLVGGAIIKSLEMLEYDDSDKYCFFFYGTNDTMIRFNQFDKQIKKFNKAFLHFLDYCILAVDNNVAKEIYEYCQLNKLKLTIIDNSSEYRLQENIPLCIPEINPDIINKITQLPYLISNPNCVTTLLCMCLKPLLQLANIKKIIVSTYQAASGAGYRGLQELEMQTEQIIQKKLTNQEKLTIDFWKKQYVFNVFSHNSHINSKNLYNEEELKLINETKKILGINPKITATCIRVPTLRSHCISAHIEFDKELTKEQIVDKLTYFTGIKILDDIIENQFPEPIITSDKTDVYVGRIRSDIDDNTCWNFFISGDQLLKGAGYNSTQILDYLLKEIK
jgi:aspartate-semialdehyde dehydrogenase